MKKILLLMLSVMSMATASYAQKVYGYIPEYQWYNYGSVIQFDKLTDVGYCFMNPTTTGAISTGSDIYFGFDSYIFDQVKTKCQQNGVRLHMVIGGADVYNYRSSRLSAVCGNSTYRATFVAAIVNFAKTHNLAGVEVDWEFPTNSTDIANHKAFILALKASIATNAPGLELSAAVGGEYLTNPNHLKYVDKTVFSSLDYVHIMAYDFPVNHTGAGVQHSSYLNAMGTLDAWNTQMSLPYSKMLLCIPFYGKSSDRSGEDQSYATLSASNAATAFLADNASYSGRTFYYNGKTTLESKITDGASKGIAGVAIWDCGQDRKDQYSLLSVVKTKVDATCSVPQPNLGLDKSICKIGDTKVLDCGISGVGSSGLSAAWYKDGALINAATSQTYSATDAGKYKVILSKTGVVCTRVSEMNLSVGSDVTVSSASRCEAGQVTLTITNPNTGTFTWWDAATGGKQVGTGQTYSPSPSANTTYYVEQQAANQKNYTIGQSTLIDNGTKGWAQILKMGQVANVFTVNQNLSIVSVKVVLGEAANGKNIKVVVYNQNGKTVVKSGAAIVATAAAGPIAKTPFTVPAAIDLVPGTYFLTVEGDVKSYEVGAVAGTTYCQFAAPESVKYDAMDGLTTVATFKGNAVQRFSSTGFIDQPTPAGGQLVTTINSVSTNGYGSLFDVMIQTGTASSSCGRAAATATILSCPTNVEIVTPSATTNLLINSTISLKAKAVQSTGISSVVFEITNTSANPVTKSTVNATLDGNSNWVADWSSATAANYTIIAKATPVQGSVKSSSSVAVSVVTGLESEFTANGFSVAPNPSTSTFNVSLTETSNVALTVYDLMGNVAETVATVNDNVSFGANLSAGVYFVKATINGKNEFFKVVKK